MFRLAEFGNIPFNTDTLRPSWETVELVHLLACPRPEYLWPGFTFYKTFYTISLWWYKPLQDKHYRENCKVLFADVPTRRHGQVNTRCIPVSTVSKGSPSEKQNLLLDCPSAPPGFQIMQYLQKLPLACSTYLYLHLYADDIPLYIELSHQKTNIIEWLHFHC